MSGGRRTDARAARIFRILLRLFPAPFRVRHGDAMVATLLEARRACGASLPARAAFWGRTVGELALQGLAERLGTAPGHAASGRRVGPAGTGGPPPRGEVLISDLRMAVRSLARSPAFTLTVSLTLALGIGANVAIFSLVDAVLLRPVPVEDPARVVEVYEALNERSPRGGLSYVTYRGLAETLPATRGMAAFSGHEAELRLADRAVVVQVGLVSGSYFDVLGVDAVRGRTLTPADEAGWGASPVAVLSHALWRTELGGDPGVVGNTVRIGDRAFTVVGVAEPPFRGIHLTSRTDLWVPVTMGAAVSGEGGLYGIPEILTEPLARVFDVVARLEEGVSTADAAARLGRARRALAEEVAEGVEEPISVLPVRRAAAVADRDELVRFLVLLGAVVGLTLLAACVNVANLLLARSRRRERDLAVLSALGAGRGRLFRQLGLEALLLGLLGGGLALVTARVGAGLLRGFTLPGEVPVAHAGLRFGVEAVALATALGVLTALLFGVLPAWRASRTDALAGLRSRAGAGGRGRGRRLLLSVQAALSVVLLVGAALFGRTLQEALATELGFRADSVAALSVRLRPHGATGADAVRLVESVLERVRSRPEVSAAAFGIHVPVSERTLGLPFEKEDGERVPGGVAINVVTPGFFETLGIPVVAGRGFDAGDRADAPSVIVVNEAAAELLWPGLDPLGRRAGIPFDPEPSTVVGVVAQTLYHDLGDRDRPYVYYPLPQLAGPASSLGSFVARGSRGAGPALAALRASVRDAAPMLPVHGGRAVVDQLDEVLAIQRFGATLLGLFGGLVLLIAAVGMHGIATWTVAARRREIGIRMALGAPARRVLAGVLGDAAAATVAGAAAGGMAAVALAGLVEAFLVGVAPLDPAAFAGALAVLGVAALVAVALPARRAVEVDPADTMRTE